MKWVEKLISWFKAKSWISITFMVCVLFPVFLGTFYYTFIASDRYVSSAGFAVRKMDTSGGIGVVGAFTGLAGAGSTTSDSYILLQYLKSRDLINELEAQIPLRELYSDNRIDFISRLPKNADVEKVVEYWGARIETSYNPSSGIITFDVEAFSDKDAEKIASLVLAHAQALVNKLSQLAREDSVRAAESEVKLAEDRLRNALQNLRDFRENEQAIDPAMSAKVQVEILGELEKELTQVHTRMASLKNSVDDDSPLMRALHREEEALTKQLEAQASSVKYKGVKQHGGKALSELLETYESLEVEKRFSEEAYASALASFETARADADRQQSYLAIYNRPAMPEKALYPRRLLDVFLIFISALGLWSIGMLITFSVRDHIA